MANPIFINRVKFDINEPVLIGRQLLSLAGLGPDHDLFLLQSEGDPTGGTPVGLDQAVELRPGMHFRAIPGNRNFG
jgi:hypothetical protein